MQKLKKPQGGFTLVELAIVLVIIGFLIAAIAAATQMIHVARLRTVITDFRNIYTAYHAFIDKYAQVPGDMNYAYITWGAAQPSCSSSGVCDGNNNDIIESNPSSESTLVWAHLGFSKMLPYYFPISNVYPASNILNVTAPASKISGAGYEIRGGTALSFASFGGFNYDNEVNAVIIGSQYFGSLTNGALQSQDAYYLDSKMDDGAASGGLFLGGGTGTIRATTGTNGDSVSYCVSPYSGYDYHVDDPNVDCLVGMSLK